jgi:hypothetical protein
MIDISSLDAETKTKLDHYSDLSKQLQKGIPVDITLKLKEKPVFQWDDGMIGCVTPNSDDEGYFKYFLDWDDLANQEYALNKKYNDSIKEITDFSDSVADSLKVDREEFFEEFLL